MVGDEGQISVEASPKMAWAAGRNGWVDDGQSPGTWILDVCMRTGNGAGSDLGMRGLLRLLRIKGNLPASIIHTTVLNMHLGKDES